MLEDYQSAFYDMMVNHQSKSLQSYVSELNGWHKNVYQNNYFQCLMASLNKVFKKTVSVLGHDNSQSLFECFVKENPSVDQNLTKYGRDLPCWIKKNELRFILPEYLKGIAELDYYLNKSYYADNSPEFSIDAFSSLSEKKQVNYCFKRLSSIEVMTSQFKLDELLLDKKVLKECFIIIYRSEGLPRWEYIDHGLYLLLNALASSSNLSELSQNAEMNLEKDMIYLINKSWLQPSE